MEELLHLLTDWPHWAFEAITDMTFAGLGYLYAKPRLKAAVKRHDREHHSGEHRCDAPDRVEGR